MNNILYAIALLLFVVLAAWVKAREAKAVAYPYERADALFTAAERAFLHALEQSAGSQFRITGKVRLGDILHVHKGLSNSQRTTARNRINQKHVDFVLCDPRSLQVVGVIELDDRSHDRPDRQRRDEFVDRALGAAGIPILHVKVQRSYNAEEVRQWIKQAFAV